MSIFSFFSRKKKKQEAEAAEQKKEQGLKQSQEQEAPAESAPAEAEPAPDSQAAEVPAAEVKAEPAPEAAQAEEAPAEQAEESVKPVEAVKPAPEVKAEPEVDTAPVEAKAEPAAQHEVKEEKAEVKPEPAVAPVKEPAPAAEPKAKPAPKAKKPAARKTKKTAKSAVKVEEPAAETKAEPETPAAPAAEAEVKTAEPKAKKTRKTKKAKKDKPEAMAEPAAEEAPAPEAEVKAAEPVEPAKAEAPGEEAAEDKEEAAKPEGEAAEGADGADGAEAADEPKDEAQEEVRETFFSRLKKTRENLAFGVSAFFKGRVIDDELYEDLETSLLTADLGVETTEFVIEKLREEAKLRELHDAALLKKRLRQILVDLLKPCEQELIVTDKKPYVILMVGVNGAGKTTTIGKLARKYKDQGLKVMLAAGDTFRAAAVEQLKEWGARADVPVISQPTGSDSASVLFDALNAAKARNIDVLICDTAGRLQNKSQLMEELKKIVRVMKKLDEEVPHEVLLVLDAATGQNAVSQTRIFKEAVDVSGICLTKLDGTAKGGVIFALADKFKLPLRFVGLGEKAEDLRPFEAEVFVDALLRGEE